MRAVPTVVAAIAAPEHTAARLTVTSTRPMARPSTSAFALPSASNQQEQALQVISNSKHKLPPCDTDNGRHSHGAQGGSFLCLPFRLFPAVLSSLFSILFYCCPVKIFINAIKAHVVLFSDSYKEAGLTSLQPLFVLRLNHTSLNRSYSHTPPSASQARQPPPLS